MVNFSCFSYFVNPMQFYPTMILTQANSDFVVLFKRNHTFRTIRLTTICLPFEGPWGSGIGMGVRERERQTEWEFTRVDIWFTDKFMAWSVIKISNIIIGILSGEWSVYIWDENRNFSTTVSSTSMADTGRSKISFWRKDTPDLVSPSPEVNLDAVVCANE